MQRWFVSQHLLQNPKPEAVESEVASFDRAPRGDVALSISASGNRTALEALRAGRSHIETMLAARPMSSVMAVFGGQRLRFLGRGGDWTFKPRLNSALVRREHQHYPVSMMRLATRWLGEV